MECCTGKPEVSLYKICLKRVYALLKTETWKSCSVNPFLNLPSRIVDDLMAHTKYDNPKISETFLVLTSGSLTRLNLSRFRLHEEHDLFLEVIRRNSCRSLRFLAWHFGEKKNIPLMEVLVRSCPKLQEFHSSQFLNFDVFRYCKDLRVLMFFSSLQMLLSVESSVNLSVLSSLRNLQVFFSFEGDGDTIATVLKYCPQLFSLGRVDSLDGLEIIHASTMEKHEIQYTEIPSHFQLKRCLWGKRTETFYQMTSCKTILYKSSFPEKIRIAVSLCPFVEKLIIYVNNTNSIESLKNLKHLSYLKISFCECDGDYMTEFFALLKIIGQKLTHLSIDGRHPVPVDTICDFCPKLRSLDVRRFATVSGPVQPHCDILLKRLRIMYIDQNALLFLLSNCKSLVELTLFYALCLDDSLLCQILRLNPLAELKISDITESSLTSRGLRMFLEKAVSLERVNFVSFRQELGVIVKDLIRELNLTNITYGEIYDIPCGDCGCGTPKYHF